MSKQETDLASETQLKHISSWFDHLTFLRKDPKLKYTTNARYQNVCGKIEFVEEELQRFEKKLNIPQENSGNKGTSWKEIYPNCNIPRQSENETISRDRSKLIADIQRILPQIRKHLV